MSVLTRAALLVLLSSAAAAGAFEICGHKVMAEILALSNAGAAGPCVSAFHEQYARIASVESGEVVFVAKEMKDGACRAVLLAEGQETSVNIPREARDHEIMDPAAAAVEVVHTHPLDNAPYFAQGHPYNGEIMFASEDAIAARRLTEVQYRDLLAAIRSGRVPGYNMSPPSAQDFLVSGGDEDYNRKSPGRVVSVVLTSGGAWTHSSPDPKTAAATIDDLVVYANMYEAANSDRVPAERRERARALLEAARRDPALASFLDAFGEASLQLRAPYSSAALAFLAAGDDSAVKKEYAEKVRSAGRFCALLKTKGIDASFTPYQ